MRGESCSVCASILPSSVWQIVEMGLFVFVFVLKLYVFTFRISS